jgi:glyoxylase-like metal-dependent hydrolase (beta-lactamase superfamily II)
MANSIQPFEVFAIRYAENPTQRSTHNFLGGDPHDEPMPLHYFVWILRRGDRSIVVDTGFDEAMAGKRKRTHLGGMETPLAALDIRVGEIKDVIITHLHYDHCGNHNLFPNARFHLQDDEMAFATGRCMCHALMRIPFDVDDVVAMVRKVFEGRVSFHQGVTELEPGLELHKVGGHTGGLQVVRVFTRRGWMVLASDASHFYANMEQARPFPVVLDVAGMLEGHRKCYALADSEQNVIPGHDPLVTARYPSISTQMQNRIMRLDADPR